MEEHDKIKNEEALTPNPIEHDYEKNNANPGPSETAVTESGTKGGGLTLKWVIPIAVILGLIFWFLMRK